MIRFYFDSSKNELLENLCKGNMVKLFIEADLNRTIRLIYNNEEFDISADFINDQNLSPFDIILKKIEHAINKIEYKKGQGFNCNQELYLQDLKKANESLLQLDKSIIDKITGLNPMPSLKDEFDKFDNNKKQEQLNHLNNITRLNQSSPFPKWNGPCDILVGNLFMCFNRILAKSIDNLNDKKYTAKFFEPNISTNNILIEYSSPLDQDLEYVELNLSGLDVKTKQIIEILGLINNKDKNEELFEKLSSINIDCLEEIQSLMSNETIKVYFNNDLKNKFENEISSAIKEKTSKNKFLKRSTVFGGFVACSAITAFLCELLMVALVISSALFCLTLILSVNLKLNDSNDNSTTQ